MLSLIFIFISFHASSMYRYKDGISSKIISSDQLSAQRKDSSEELLGFRTNVKSHLFGSGKTELIWPIGKDRKKAVDGERKVFPKYGVWYPEKPVEIHYKEEITRTKKLRELIVSDQAKIAYFKQVKINEEVCLDFCNQNLCHDHQTKTQVLEKLKTFNPESHEAIQAKEELQLAERFIEIQEKDAIGHREKILDYDVSIKKLIQNQRLTNSQIKASKSNIIFHSAEDSLGSGVILDSSTCATNLHCIRYSTRSKKHHYNLQPLSAVHIFNQEGGDVTQSLRYAIVFPYHKELVTKKEFYDSGIPDLAFVVFENHLHTEDDKNPTLVTKEVVPYESFFTFSGYSEQLNKHSLFSNKVPYQLLASYFREKDSGEKITEGNREKKGLDFQDRFFLMDGGHLIEGDSGSGIYRIGKDHQLELVGLCQGMLGDNEPIYYGCRWSRAVLNHFKEEK